MTATKIKRGNITYVRLEGSFLERTRQHAQLLRQEIQEGAIPVLAKKNEWLIRRAGGPLNWRPLQQAVVGFYHHVLLPMLQRSLRPHEVEMMRIMARESGLPFKTFQRAMFQADGLMLLSRTSMMKHLIKDFALGHLPACSSVAVMGPWTVGGEMLVARNQDYPIVGPWEKNTLVAFHEPSEAGEVPHISISSAGLHTSGLTSMNAHGLTLAAHAHFGLKVSAKGLPIFVVGQEIISRAKTISEAIDIARKHPRNANWALMIASAREKTAAVLEMTPNQVVARYQSDGLINHTNYFHSPELAKSEAMLSPSRMEDDHARWCRLRQILTPHKGAIGMEQMTKVMGDHIDPWTNVERIMGNTVSVMSTIKSVVFVPGQQKLWVSDRGRSPMGLGPFVEIDVENFWKNPELQQRTLFGNRPSTPNFEEQLDLYRQAYMTFHTHPEKDDYLEKTLEILCLLLKKNCQDAHVWAQTAHLAFKLGRFNDALGFYQQTLKMPMANEVAQGRDLMLARCYDLCNQRPQALELYQSLAKQGQGPLKEAAAAGIAKAYRQAQAASVMVDLQFPDPMAY